MAKTGAVKNMGNTTPAASDAVSISDGKGALKAGIVLVTLAFLQNAAQSDKLILIAIACFVWYFFISKGKKE